jgi:hypothetical protein
MAATRIQRECGVFGLRREYGGSKLPWVKPTVGIEVKSQAANAATAALIPKRDRPVREPPSPDMLVAACCRHIRGL